MRLSPEAAHVRPHGGRHPPPPNGACADRNGISATAACAARSDLSRGQRRLAFGHGEALLVQRGADDDAIKRGQIELPAQVG